MTRSAKRNGRNGVKGGAGRAKPAADLDGSGASAPAAPRPRVTAGPVWTASVWSTAGTTIRSS